MKRDPTFFFDVVGVYFFGAVLLWWLDRLGYLGGEAVPIAIITYTIVSAAYAIRWVRLGAVPRAKLAARFSLKNLLKWSAVCAVLIASQAAGGWAWRTIGIEAVFVFGFGGLLTAGEWILWRRYVRQFAQDGSQPGNSDRQAPALNEHRNE